MGTTFRIVLYAPDQTSAERAIANAFRRIAELDSTLSDYRETSELSRITREAVNHPTSVSADLFNVLAAAERLSSESSGAFDITVGTLSRLWRRARRQLELPSPDDLRGALAVTGHALVKLDSKSRTVALQRAGVRLDAGGIAKGYAADQARAQLADAGFARVLVAAGGDLAIGDAPPGKRGWEVILAGLDPDRAAPSEPLVLARCGVSTSGDAEQWVQIGAVRYSHIVDPRTGMALQGRKSVSVVAANATSSDMLATALSVLGPLEGAQLVARYSGAASLVGVRGKTGDRWAKSERWDRVTRHQ
jgi:thiamine biosynthesis lipoprotein